MTTARDIAESLEERIAAGELRPRDTLPSVRELARTWDVSAGTAAKAYRILSGRGLVTSRPGQSTRVSPQLSLKMKPGIVLTADQRDLSHGNPNPRFLPQLDAVINKLDLRPRMYGESTLNLDLAAIAASGFQSDGVPGGNIAVVNGAIDGLDRLLTIHTRVGDNVIVEDPTYMMVLGLLGALGRNPIPVAVDDRGMIPESLEQALRQRPKALIVVPRAQNPTGAAFDAQRAEELRRVLADNPELLVIENDHAGAVAGVPYFSLVGGRERWAVIRTVSKSLGPDLRVATLAGDGRTVDSLASLQMIGGSWVSNLLQQIVVHMWQDRVTEALWTEATATYAQRRTAMLAALGERGVPARGTSGLNVMVPVSDEVLVVGNLLQRGWLVRAGESYRINSGPFVRITTAVIGDDEIEPLADALVGTLRPSQSRAVYG